MQDQSKSLLQGLLGSVLGHIAEELGSEGGEFEGRIKRMKARWKSADNLAQQVKVFREILLEDEDEFRSSGGPIGFPLMYGSEQQSLTQWLASSGVLTASDQAKVFCDTIGTSMKMKSGDLKRIQKNWTVEPTKEGMILSELVFHPEMRMTIPFSVNTTGGYRKHVLGYLIRGAHRLMGWKEPDSLKSLKDFYAQWKPPKGTFEDYWPTLLWHCEPSITDEDRKMFERDNNYSENLADFGHSVIKMMYRFQLEASSRWESMTNSEKNGVLLAGFCGASFLKSKALLAGYLHIDPELQKRIDVGRASNLGLSNADGQPTQLLRIACRAASLHERYPEESSHNYAVRLLSPLSSGLDDLLANIDQASDELQAYRSHYIAKAIFSIKTAEGYFKKLAPGLPKECASAIEQFGDHVQEWMELSGVRLGDDGERTILSVLARDDKAGRLARDFWQKELLTREQKYKSDAFHKWLDKLELHRMKALREEAQEAALEMDTDKLAGLAADLEVTKKAVIASVENYTGALAITDEQRQAVPVPEEAPTQPEVSREQAKALLDELEELRAERELSQLAEAELKHENQQLRTDLHNATTRAEAAEHSASNSHTGEPALPMNVLTRALGEQLTLKDTLDTVSALFPHVEVLPSAYEASNGCGYKNVRKVMDYLLRLCGDYYHALIVEGKPDTVAREHLGNCYRPNESDTTLAIPKLRAHREFVYKDQGKIVFTQHLTLGVKRGDQTSLQVYFKVINKKLVIAYVGPHLPISSS